MRSICVNLALALSVLLLGFGAGGSYRAQAPSEREPLRGLTGVYVVAEDLPDLMAQKGITKGRLQAIVEERLKAGGVVVLTREAWLNTAGTPLLYLNVNINAAKGQGLLACSIGLTLAQRATLERDPGIRTLARTWQTGRVGLLAESDVPGIQDQILALVDQFISDLKAANRPG